MGLINDQLKAYRVALNRDMAAAQWFQVPVWAPMIGHLNGMDGKYPKSIPFGGARANVIKPTGKPIEVLTDFHKQDRSWEMDIPIIYPLTEEPVYGDNQVMGTEESRQWAYNRAIINQVRKGVITKDGAMGEYALNAKMVMQIMDQAAEELTFFNQRWQAYAPYDALTRRWSRNVLASKSLGGFGDVLTQQSHPNFFVAGTGQITFSQTASTYETNVAAGLDQLTNTSSDYFGTKVIKNALFYAGRLRVTATKIGNNNVRLVGIISDAQANQLFDDEDFKKLHIALTQKDGEKSALFTGDVQAYLYLGVLLIVDSNAPGVWTSGDSDYSATRGTVNYGNVNPFLNPIMASDRKLAFFFGASAVMCGHVKSLGFKSMNWDYENKKSEASNTIVGYNRSDIYDRDGMFGTQNNFKENTSSFIVGTYSPNSPSW